MNLQATYHTKFKGKARSAARDFVLSLPAKKHISSCDIFSGPEGQVIIEVTTTRPTKLRNKLGKLSATMLNRHGVWIVGLPRKSEKTKQHSIDALLVRRKK